MTEQILGVLLMSGTELWLCWLLLCTLRSKTESVEVDILSIVIAAVCWMAGRVLAGNGLFKLLIS